MTNDLIKKNYHTHTYRCKHAEGEVRDYVKAAVEKGLTVLGMTDHMPFPDGRWDDVRMDYKDLGGYIRAIHGAREEFPQIRLLKGLECEYTKEYHSLYEDEFMDKLGFEYLIASAHYFPYEGSWLGAGLAAREYSTMKAYTDYLVMSMETGIFEFLGHPDMFGAGGGCWNEDIKACSRFIFEAAQALKMPIEINAYGFRKPKIQTSEGIRYQYPLEPFWELAAQYDISVIVNSDAHKPEEIVGEMEKAYDMARRYNFKLADLSHLEK